MTPTHLHSIGLLAKDGKSRSGTIAQVGAAMGFRSVGYKKKPNPDVRWELMCASNRLHQSGKLTQ